MLRIETLPYAGWQQCLRIANGEIELVVTLEVGPRIIRYGFTDDRNVFVEYADQLGKKGESVYHSYGGHRLWVAPEERPKTYYPDNNPVEWEQKGEWISFRPPVESRTSFQKEVRVSLDPSSSRVRVAHQITNQAKIPQSVAAWALSVMAPGGRAILPHEPFKAHTDYLLPVRPLVFWGYTEMTDPRWKWGKKYIQLLQDAKAPTPQKIGALNTSGWMAYVNDGGLFLKRFPFLPDAVYPDFGSNCELFTNHKMLELESLSPLVTLKPGESVGHEEQWYLFRGLTVGERDEEIDKALQPILGKIR